MLIPYIILEHHSLLLEGSVCGPESECKAYFHKMLHRRCTAPLKVNEKRVRRLTKTDTIKKGGKSVIYWMSRDQRSEGAVAILAEPNIFKHWLGRLLTELIGVTSEHHVGTYGLTYTALCRQLGAAARPRDGRAARGAPVRGVQLGAAVP